MKILSALLSLALLALFLPPAFAAGLPSIEEALLQAPGRIEVRDDVFSYVAGYEADFSMTGLRCLVLELLRPEYRFTETEYSCEDPRYQNEPLDAPRVFLRSDLMTEYLPSVMWASSLADADVLIVGETEYYLDGEITHTEYENGGNDAIPSYVHTPEELQSYLILHPKTPKRVTYKPLYGAVSYTNLYSPPNKGWNIYNYQLTPYTLTASNEKAASQWDAMKELTGILELLEDYRPEAQLDKIVSAVQESGVMADVVKESVLSQAQQGNYQSAALLIRGNFWYMASILSEMDDSPEAKEWYPQLIEKRDIDLLSMFVASRGYNSVHTPDDVIIGQKMYIGQPDPAWFDQELASLLTTLLQSLRSY